MVEKKKKSKTGLLLKSIFGGFLLLVSIYFWTQIFQDVQTNKLLRIELGEAEAELEALKNEKSSLQNQKEKLSDVNYISSVARGKYLISTSNEQIYVLPSLDD